MYIDIKGQKFSYLLVIKRANLPDKKGKVYWDCICDCGNKTIVFSHKIRSGKIKSCGCKKSEAIRKSRTKHGMYKTKFYGIWNKIRNRTLCITYPAYKYYGARGIKLCKHWDKFECFKEDLYESYLKHKSESTFTSLERVDNNKGYSPENCKWVGRFEQANNRRSNILFTLNGETKNLKQWCNQLGINYKITHQRMRKYKFSFEKAIQYDKKRKMVNSI